MVTAIGFDGTLVIAGGVLFLRLLRCSFIEIVAQVPRYTEREEEA